MDERAASKTSGDDWGWDAHERAQRQRLAKVPLAEKITWLEEAHRMVLTLAQQRSTAAKVSERDHETG
jgi:hypothetical protein